MTKYSSYCSGGFCSCFHDFTDVEGESHSSVKFYEQIPHRLFDPYLLSIYIYHGRMVLDFFLVSRIAFEFSGATRSPLSFIHPMTADRVEFANSSIS